VTRSAAPSATGRHDGLVEPALRKLLVFVGTKDDTGASQTATTTRKGYDEQQLAAVVTIAEEDRNDDTPIFLGDITPPNIPRNAENLVPQGLDPAYKQPDARPAAGIRDTLISEQKQGGENPWHGRRNETARRPSEEEE
jgi:hypothetical protein